MTYRWEPTTPLDRIMETGFKRMDEAVEGVIANYTWTMSDVRRCLVCDKVNPHRHQDFCYDLGCSGRMDKPVIPFFKERIDISAGYAAVSNEDTRQLQRERNYRIALQAERAALAPRPDWGRMGFNDIGNQLS